MFDAELFWKLFKLTGSVNAYILYKKLMSS
ncbi:YqzL family protein [Clostridiaceae bacterium M8S5]|nr:YqzL family protein [Clostridiaceae bacterium M8S5]